MALAYIGLGSNLDDPVSRLQQAVQALGRFPETSVEACSPLYRTAPLGYERQPDFVNAVCRLITDLTPLALLDQLQEAEKEQGRIRSKNRNGPRTLDLDLLLYNQQVMNTDRLVVPHARLHERAFVLYPLHDLDPDLVIPGRGPVSVLKNHCADQKIERLEHALEG